MATHDYSISNQTFPSTRSDINAVLSAIVSNNSSATEPSTTYAYMWWYDTTTTTLKFRNRDNDAWVGFATFDMDNDTVNFLDSTVTIAGISTSATGTTFTLSDTDNKSSVDFIIDNEKKLVLREASGNGTNYVALKAPASLASDVTFTLPSADGTADQVLKTDGSGNLSFTDVSGGISWQSSIVTGSTLTAVAGNGYWIDTTLNACTITLPASANVGDQIIFVDYDRTWTTNNVTIDINGLNYQGGTDNPVYDTSGQTVNIVYSGATNGWIPISDDDVVDEGIIPPYPVEYLVVAGGGSGGADNAGGGGAGGLLTNYGGAGLDLTVGTTYTLTVGAGATGVSGATDGLDGNDSTITGSGLTTITSYGGGGGGTAPNQGLSGGSGGGNGFTNTGSGGAGTVGQGNDGGSGAGSGTPPAYGAGGGGGAGFVGGNGSSSAAGDGGDGLSNSITGSAIYYAGGGGGAGNASGTEGSGGLGGGGAGTVTGTAPSGTVNTGGGGGGGGTNSGGGGSGIIILRMLASNYSGTTTGSPTVTDDGSYKVIKFTGTGTYTA